MTTGLGPAYTKGTSYRARAETRQREFRAGTLRVGHGAYGHFLARAAADDGQNFLLPEVHAAALARQRQGKGVVARTFQNMLASQAMCFNIFFPLSLRPRLATQALKPFVPDLAVIKAITLEHTPTADVFNDQAGLAGVDCDVLLEGTNTRGEQLLVVIETKFIEREFSICGFRKPGRKGKGRLACPEDVHVRDDRNSCLYVRNKGYSYWSRSDQHDLLAEGALPDSGCPFAGGRWQLWVNLVLAHEEARRRGATDVRFAVCASPSNEQLLRNGEALDTFRALLRRPEAVQLVDLELLLKRIGDVALPELRDWATRLSARYGGI